MGSALSQFFDDLVEAGNPGEMEGQVGQDVALDILMAVSAEPLVRKVVGGITIAQEDDLIVAEQGVPGRGLAADVGSAARDDKGVYLLGPQDSLQLRIVEGAVAVLLDEDIVALRLDFLPDPHSFRPSAYRLARLYLRKYFRHAPRITHVRAVDMSGINDLDSLLPAPEDEPPEPGHHLSGRGCLKGRPRSNEVVSHVHDNQGRLGWLDPVIWHRHGAPPPLMPGLFLAEVIVLD